MKVRMRTWLPSFMTGMFDPVGNVLIDGLLKPLLRGIINGVVDAFVDIFCVLLVVIMAIIISADCAPLGDSIEAEILFYCPPAMTIMLSGSLILRLSRALTSLIIKHFNSYMTAAATPQLGRSISHSLSEVLHNNMQSSLLVQLKEPLVHTLSYGLKDAVPHYYYCTHCYYYGGMDHINLDFRPIILASNSDYCQYCFYQRDYNWLDRSWWQGRLHPRNPREEQPEETSEADTDNNANRVKEKLPAAIKRKRGVPLTQDMAKALRIAAKAKKTPNQDSENSTQ